MSTTQQVLLIVVVVLALGALGALGWMMMRRRELRQRFGPEYERVAEQDGPRAAGRELRDRERRHAELELRDLDPEATERYAAEWDEVQARFVDDPAGAVKAGDELVTRLVAERGYPTEEYDDQLATLSVEHARVLGNYRDAHDIKLRSDRGEASTEELRQALVHYHALFADLLGTERSRS